MYLDDAVFMQAAEPTAHGFQYQAQITRNFIATHWQHKVICGPADAPVTVAQALQEHRDTLAGLTARQHIHMVLIAVGGLFVLLILALVLRWGLAIASRAPDRFSQLLAGGMTATIFDFQWWWK